MAITILLRTYYNLRLLFLYVNRNTYIRKSIEMDFVKKYRIYENNELLSDSHFVCACHRSGVGTLAELLIMHDLSVLFSPLLTSESIILITF